MTPDNISIPIEKSHSLRSKCISYISIDDPYLVLVTVIVCFQNNILVWYGPKNTQVFWYWLHETLLDPQYVYFFKMETYISNSCITS